MRSGIITEVAAVQYIKEGLSRLQVTMDDFSTYTVFGNQNDYLQYIDKEVEFEVREDLVNGIIEEVICTIAVRSIVQTVDTNGDFVDEFDINTSLIPEKSKAVDVITFDCNTLKAGDVAKSQIVLVSGAKKGKSKVSRWTDFTCLDVNSKAFNLRLFTNADEDAVDQLRKETVGRYAMVDIKHEAKYGLQVFGAMQVYEEEVQIPSEALLAAFNLSMLAKRDEKLDSYVKKFDMIDKLKKTIYFEPGYHLVEMAAEVMLIKTLCRIFEGYNRELLYRAVFASRGYLLGANTDLSNPLVNYHRIIISDLKEDTKLIRLIDFMGGVEEGDLDKSAYLSIRKQVTSIMKGRRGLNETHNLNTAIADIDSEFSGLFHRGIEGLD